MVVSTIYDKDLKQKVFQVRGSERYTNSTQTTLEIEYDNSHKSYLEVTLTSTVKRKIGSSSIVFYCDDTILGIVACNESDSEVEATYQVSYGYHKFYAKYVGNTQCLSSKSGIIELEGVIPDIPETSITINTFYVYAGWIEDLDNAGIYLTLKDDENNVLIGKDVLLYVNDEYLDTITVASQMEQLPIQEYSVYGKHVHIKAVFEGDDSYFACEAERTFNQGYDIVATPVYDKICLGDNTRINVALSQSDGIVLRASSVSLYDSNDTLLEQKNTNMDGIASFNGEYLTTAGTHTLKAVKGTNGDYDNATINVVSIDNIATEYLDDITAKGFSAQAVFVPYANGAKTTGLPVTVGSDVLLTNSAGEIDFQYDGTGAGKVNINVAAGSCTTSAVIQDTYQYFSKSQQKNYNLNYSVRNSLAVVDRYYVLELFASDVTGYFILEGEYVQPVSFSPLVFPNWKFEFDIIRHSNYNTLTVCGVEIPRNMIMANAHVTAERFNDYNLTIVTVNDTEIRQYTSSTNRADITIGSGMTLGIDNLKIMRL